MKLTDLSLYQDGHLVAPAETRFSYELKSGEDSNEIQRYRLIAVVGSKTQRPLAMYINMLLTHNQAAIINRCMHGEEVEEDGGCWARRSTDIAYELGRACSFDSGLKKRLIRIVWDYLHDENNHLAAVEREVKLDLDIMQDDCDNITLQNIVVFLLTVTDAITYYPGSLEKVSAPFDEYDFVIDYEDDGFEAENQRYAKIVEMLHPELSPNAEKRTITITDAAGNVFANVEVDPIVWRKVERGESVFQATMRDAIRFLSEVCVENKEYGELVESAHMDMLKAGYEQLPGLAKNEEVVRQLLTPIDRDALSEDELWEKYYDIVSCFMTWWNVTDDKTGKTYSIIDRE